MHKLIAGSILLGLASCTMMQTVPATPGFVVFFTERSSTLEATGADAIAQAAAASRAKPEASVAVLGWTDSGGNASADQTLSQQRAQAVADALVADGVPAARITRQGRGQTHDDPGVESRRVEIRVGG